MKVLEPGKLLGSRPFKPVRFHFSDGSSVDVGHPGTAVITESALHVYTQSERPGIMEGDWISVAPSQIVKAKFIREPEAHKDKGNGKTKK